MPILSGELKLYKSETVGDGDTNGGRMSANEVVSGAASNLFPPVQQSERIGGGLKWRKAFYKVENDADLPLLSPKLFLDKNTPGDDIITFFPGTQTDVQSGLTGYERQYGGGLLATGVSALATEMTVLVEDPSLGDELFQIGDTVRVTDKEDVNDSGGNEEYVLLSDVQVDSNGLVTLVFSPPLQNEYLASDARVQSVYEPDDIVSSFDSLIVTSGSTGDFDENFLFADNIGSVEQAWTLTFTSPTAFDIVGDTLGAVGSGNTGSGATPNNPDFSKPYFAMQASGFSGTWQIGDTITFSTHPAAVPVWVRRLVPPNSDPLANNPATIALKGETA